MHKICAWFNGLTILNGKESSAFFHSERLPVCFPVPQNPLWKKKKSYSKTKEFAQHVLISPLSRLSVDNGDKTFLTELHHLQVFLFRLRTDNKNYSWLDHQHILKNSSVLKVLWLYANYESETFCQWFLLTIVKEEEKKKKGTSDQANISFPTNIPIFWFSGVLML